jgi:hypothetical protein
VNPGGVEFLDRGSPSLREPVDNHIFLEANRADGDIVIAIGRVDAEVRAYGVAANDIE